MSFFLLFATVSHLHSMTLKQLIGRAQTDCHIIYGIWEGLAFYICNCKLIMLANPNLIHPKLIIISSVYICQLVNQFQHPIPITTPSPPVLYCYCFQSPTVHTVHYYQLVYSFLTHTVHTVYRFARTN